MATAANPCPRLLLSLSHPQRTEMERGTPGRPGEEDIWSRVREQHIEERNPGTGPLHLRSRKTPRASAVVRNWNSSINHLRTAARLFESMSYMSACQFVSRHQPLALYLAGGMTSNRDEAEDLAQEVLCRALKNWRWLDQKRTLSPWLRAVMKNAFIDSRRKADRSRCVSIEAPVQDGRAIGDFLAAGDSLPEDELLRREEVMNVRRVLAKAAPRPSARFGHL